MQKKPILSSGSRLLIYSPIIVISMASCPIMMAQTGYSKAPIIVENPKNQFVKAGDNATFAVKASGDNLSFKWYMNDVALKNINSPNVRVSNVKVEHHGIKFYVVVTNAFGAVTSEEAVLQVNTTPSSPAIKLFRALPNTINPGQKARLEAVYPGGQGVVTPGGMLISPNHYLEVSPTITTTYHLTVTLPDGQKAVADATITVVQTAQENSKEWPSQETINVERDAFNCQYEIGEIQ